MEKVWKKILSYVLAVVMIVGMLPSATVKAEGETDPVDDPVVNSYETGLYFAQWDNQNKTLNDLNRCWYTEIPDEVGIALLYADEGAATYQSVDVDNVAITYAAVISDNSAEIEASAFSEPEEGQIEEVQLSEQEYNSWAVKEIDGGTFISETKIPVSYYRFYKTGTYRFTYSLGENEYSCYLTVEHKAWDFYAEDEISDNPLRDYYYRDITEDTAFYLKQADGNVSLGKLTYAEDGAVCVDESGNPVLDTETGAVVAARFEWDNDTQQEKVVNYNDCISYYNKTGKISIVKNPEDNTTDYVVRVYYYNKNERLVGEDLVTDYWQGSADVWVHHGEDMSSAIWVGYDNYQGSASWKLKGVADAQLSELAPYENVVGQNGEDYDIYLTEKPNYPDGFDWDAATEEQRNQYGWREGAKPVVYVHATNGEDRIYRVGDETNPIDDCGDKDVKTWHFSYCYQAEDGIDIFWSDYDAFSYNDTEQFMIEMDSQDPESSDTITFSPAPAEGDYFRDESYGEKYRFHVSALEEGGTGVSVTFAPGEGSYLDNVWIGDTQYVNVTCDREQDSEVLTFTPEEDGSWTYTFTLDEVKQYRNDEEGKRIPDTDQNGKQRYASIRVNPWFGQAGQNFFEQGFRWDVYPESETMAQTGVTGVSYKVNDAEEWTELTRNNDGDLRFIQELAEDNTITVRYQMADGYAISETNFDVSYQTEWGDRVAYQPVEEDETTAQMIAALMSAEGYTFTFTPEKSSEDADGNATITATDALLRLQFHVERVFEESCNIHIFIQNEAGKNEDGSLIYGEFDENGNYVEQTQPNAEIAFRFNENFYGGQGILPEEVPNDGENPLTIQYISTIPGGNKGELVEVTPNTFFDFTAGGYSSGDSVSCNEIELEDELIDEVYMDFDQDGIFSAEEKIDPVIETDEDGKEYEIQGCYRISIGAAETYSLFIRKHRSPVATLSWSYIRNEEDPYQDDLVEHGKVYVKEIKRGDTVLLGDMQLDEKGNVILDQFGLPIYETMEMDDRQVELSPSSGNICAENGDEVTLLLVPTYGYQLDSANINGQEGTPQEERSTFKVTLNGNLHFGGVFVPAEDKTDVTSAAEVSAATIANGENAADSGNLSLTVADNTTYTKDVTAAVQKAANETAEKLISLDLTLDNIVSKGVENQYWTDSITAFEKDITVGLTLNDMALANGESLSVVRDHNGTLTELTADYDAATKTLSFPTNQFSTYTIVKKAVKETPAHVHTTTKVAAKAATCTTPGYTEYYTCSCRKWFKDAAATKEIIDKSSVVVYATGHKWDDGKVTKEATASEEGAKTFTCSVCGETKTESIPATGIPEKGEKVQDDKGTASFVVTGTDEKNLAVAYAGATNKKAKTIKVPSTVKVNGVTYQVTAIANNAFKNNKTVTKVTIPKSVTTIGKNAFSGCTKIKTISIGSKVTTIGANAFKGCKSLTKITLPDKTTKIGANAFNGCKNLKMITIKSKKLTLKSVSKNAFKGIPSQVTIKVPKGKAELYLTLLRKRGLSKKVTVK